MYLWQRPCSGCGALGAWCSGPALIPNLLATQERMAQATARVLEAMARKGKLVRHLRGLVQQA